LPEILTKYTDQKTIAFFDFDGTITSQDSLVCFLKETFGSPRFYLGVFSMMPVLLAYKLKLLSNHDAKEKFIAHYFKGWSVDDFKKSADSYSQNGIDIIVRPDAKEKLQWHQDQGHKVVVVSASIESWLQLWCDNNKYELIGTKLEIKNGKVTGKFSTRNCYGQEKVNRITNNYSLEDYSDIYAYGDSMGDREMISISNHPNYRQFKMK
jgi:HAD superfamily hydrolase (TIGR01490 family)